MRGDVLAANVRQCIGINLMRVVAQHRAHAALRVVVLVLGKAVVDKEHRATRQLVSQCAYKAFGLGVNLSQVVMGASHLKRWS